MVSAAPVAIDRLGERVDIFGVDMSITTYEDAVERIMEAARENRSFGVSALAVHGLMEAVNDASFRAQVNGLDLVTPDGQPVRWAMNILHKAGLAERVYGPDLTWHVIEACAHQGVSLYLYGSTPETCELFAAEINRRYPKLEIADIQPDRFRDATPEEDLEDIERITKSGAGVVLVGRGCPRQEKWTADHQGKVPAAMLAVGAAFDYGAGTLDIPPAWMQKLGLQWLWRLMKEPGRLWKRYWITNSQYVFELVKAYAKRSRKG